MKKLTALMGSTMMALAAPAMAADIVIGVPNWPSVNATAHILKVAIEQNMGLEVELQNGTNPIVFEAMDSKVPCMSTRKSGCRTSRTCTTPMSRTRHRRRMNPNGVEAFQGMCCRRPLPTSTISRPSIDDLTNPDIAALFRQQRRRPGRTLDRRTRLGLNQRRKNPRQVIRLRPDDGADRDPTKPSPTPTSTTPSRRASRGSVSATRRITSSSLHDLQILEEPAYDAAKWNVIQPTDDPATGWRSPKPAWPGTLAYLHLHYAKSR